jgi:hypothetical protein
MGRGPSGPQRVGATCRARTDCANAALDMVDHDHVELAGVWAGIVFGNDKRDWAAVTGELRAVAGKCSDRGLAKGEAPTARTPSDLVLCRRADRI